MKKIIVIVMITGLFSLCATAQQIRNDQVPAAVGKSYRDKFPSGQQEIWSKAGDSLYEVTFFSGKKRQSAQFELSGKWMQTETEIPYNELPTKVMQSFNKQFPGFTIQESSQLETPDKGILYELSVFKGRENYDVLFSANGEVLKKEAGESGE